MPRGSSSLAIVLLLCLGSPLAGQTGTQTYAGRRLEEVLRDLQATGLRIIFTSELVTRDMRVQSDPRATTTRERLDELLLPHGLGTKVGPGDVIQIVRKKRTPDRDAHVSAPKAASSSPARYSVDPGIEPGFRERVVVTGSPLPPTEHSFGAARRLNSMSLGSAGGALVDDPLHVAHALPGVMAGDDFRSELSVRGSPYRHTAVVVDGVATSWLTHAAPNRGVAGSVSMFRADVVDRAELHLGAYPRRHGNNLGAELELTLDEGSRTSTRFRGAVSSTNTSVTGEGPIGTSGRGSWLIAGRQSHIEWPLGRNDHDTTVFGFADVQSKLVYDVGASQQLSVSLVAGRSAVERETIEAATPADGMNRAAMLNIGWRSLSRGFVVQQRASLVTREFADSDGSGQPLDGGNDRALAYRVNLTRALGRSVVDVGGHVERVNGFRGYVPQSAFSSAPAALSVDRATWLMRSAYAHFRWTVTPRLVVAPGLRVADSSLVDRQAVDRWLQAEWSLAPRWMLHGSSGVVHQFPSLEHLPVSAGASSLAGLAGLRPERAVHLDVGVGHRLSDSLLWDVTIFSRRERDILREPDDSAGFVDGRLGLLPAENALAGSAHGMELRLERRHSTGLSGWVGYAYGRATYTDSARGEIFPADLDQRHGLAVSGSYRWSDRLTGSALFRAGSRVPVPGYLAARPGGLYVDTERNRVRLPAYARLDLRLERSFRAGNRRRFAVFGEVLNTLNRTNIGAARGVIRHDTGQAVGFTERLFPRLFSVGVRAEF